MNNTLRRLFTAYIRITDIPAAFGLFVIVLVWWTSCHQ